MRGRVGTTLPEDQAPGTYRCDDVQGCAKDGQWEFILPSLGVDLRALDVQLYATGKAHLVEVEPP